MAILPPWVMLDSISRSAAGLPDISSPISKPSRMPSLAMTSVSVVSLTLAARVTPIRSARASRYSDTSLMAMYRAPACLATIAAIRPIGPAPVIRMSSPRTGNVSTVCTALPKGSKIAATSRSISGGCRQAFVAGSAMYSANAPG